MTPRGGGGVEAATQPPPRDPVCELAGLLYRVFPLITGGFTYRQASVTVRYLFHDLLTQGTHGHG